MPEAKRWICPVCQAENFRNAQRDYCHACDQIVWHGLDGPKTLNHANPAELERKRFRAMAGTNQQIDGVVNGVAKAEKEARAE